MNTTEKMDFYQPIGGLNYDSNHTLLYTFQYEDAIAQIVTEMSGNVSGGAVMTTDFESGMTVHVDHELTQKHVEFYDDEDIQYKYREIGKLKFFHQNGDETLIDLEECSGLLIGIQIIGFKSTFSEEEI